MEDWIKWKKLSREEKEQKIKKMAEERHDFLDFFTGKERKEYSEEEKRCIDDFMSLDCVKQMSDEVITLMFRGPLKGKDNYNCRNNFKYIYDNHKDFFINYFCCVTDMQNELVVNLISYNRAYYSDLCTQIDRVFEHRNIEEYKDVCREFAKRGYYISCRYSRYKGFDNQFMEELKNILIDSVKDYECFKNIDLSKMNLYDFGLYANSDFRKERAQKNREYINTQFIENSSNNDYILEQLKDNSINFNEILKNISNKNLKQPEIMDALNKRLKQYTNFGDFDLTKISGDKEKFLDYLKSVNFDKEPFIEKCVVEK